MPNASWWRSRRHGDGEGSEPASSGDERDDRADLAAESDPGEAVVSWAGPDELARIEGGFVAPMRVRLSPEEGPSISWSIMSSIPSPSPRC